MSRTGRYAHVEIGRIPFARAVLLEMAAELRQSGSAQMADQLHDVVYDLMHRRRPVHATRAKRRSVTAEMIPEVKRYSAEHPGMNEDEIAAVFGIGGGRVSEILQGLRTVEDPQMSRFRKR